MSDQGLVVHDRNSQLVEELRGWRSEEIAVSCAKHVRFTNNSSLHNNDIVYVTNRGCKQRVEGNHFRNFAPEVDKLVYLLLRHAMDSHQSWIAQHLGNFVEHFVGQDQGMFGGDDRD